MGVGDVSGAAPADGASQNDVANPTATAPARAGRENNIIISYLPVSGYRKPVDSDYVTVSPTIDPRTHNSEVDGLLLPKPTSNADSFEKLATYDRTLPKRGRRANAITG
jgi:hypothetical protein